VRAVALKEQLHLYGRTSSTRKPPDGKTTSDLIVSAHVGSNEDLFPQILKLHVPPGSAIADVTFGKGIFWKNVSKGIYKLKASDIQSGMDCRKLRYGDASIDCVVFDPPYMEGLFRRNENHMAGAGNYAPFRNTYSDRKRKPEGPKYHAAVLDLYFRGGREAYRVLRNEGLLIVKCQDEVSANQQRLTHVEIINEFQSFGFYCKDLFVLVRTNRPAVSRMLRQEHARKNHSYFLVFVKTNGANPKGKGLMDGSSRRLAGDQGRAQRNP
jgi:DNA modification methylase